MTSKTPAGQPACDPCESIDRRRQLQARQAARRHRFGGRRQNDKAEHWLNSPQSIGVGAAPTGCRHTARPRKSRSAEREYWGAAKPAFDTVVIRNMVAATQLINVGRGTHEVAIDLASDQAQTLKSNSKVKVYLQPSTWVFWLFANNDPRVGGDVEQAVADGSTLRARLQSIPLGRRPRAYQTPGLIPSMFLGALPAKEAVKQDVAKAKAALQASGQSGQSISLGYPSDLTINGVPFATHRRSACSRTCRRSGST